MGKPNEEEEVYDLGRYPSPGLAILVNQLEFPNDPELRRAGSEKDVEDLQKVFGDLGFTVEVVKDPSRKEIEDQLQKYAKSPDLKEHASLVVVVMTHGHQGGVLLAQDESYLASLVWRPFLECPGLEGKPKFFFFQACRGAGTEQRLMLPPGKKTDSRPTSDQLRLPHAPEVLVAYSTVEERLAARDEVHGSFFIQRLCKELPSWRVEGADIVGVLTKVTERVVTQDDVTFDKFQGLNLGQTPTFVSFLTRKVVFSRASSIIKSDGPLVETTGTEGSAGAESFGTTSTSASLTACSEYPWSRRQQPSHAYLLYDSQHKEEAERFKNVLGKDLKFKVDCKPLPEKWLYQDLLRFSLSWDLYHVDCVLVCVLAHLEEDFFQSADFRFPLQQVWQPFFSSSCFNLAGKPKLFFFLDAQKSNDEQGRQPTQYASRRTDAIGAHQSETHEDATNFATDHSDALIVRGYGTDFLGHLFHGMSTALENTRGMVDMLTGIMRTCAQSVQNRFRSHFESTLRHKLVIRHVEAEPHETPSTMVTVPSRATSQVFKTRNSMLHIYEYQKHMLMLVLLRCRQKGVKFTLAADYDEAGKFSSVVLRFLDPDRSGHFVKVYLKLKHRSSTEKMYCMLDEVKKDRNSKYLKEFYKSHKLIPRKDNETVYCIVYTNCTLTYGDMYEGINIEESSLQDVNLEFPNIFFRNNPKKIVDERVKANLQGKMQGEDVETFFSEFLLAFNQLSNAELKEKVDEEILSIVHGDRRRSLIAYSIFRTYIDQWLLEVKVSEFMDHERFEDFFNKYIQGIRN